jgi:tripartite-type tricarboxylate transporter receptor subunit TctC
LLEEKIRETLMSRKSLAGLLAGVVVAAFVAAPASAQPDYPARPITVIVPFAAGGPTDTITRIVGEHMSRTLGQQLVVENVVGAGGTTASTRAKRATPDGYTIITGHMGTHAASVGLYPNLQYDPRTDFEPIGMIAGTPILILAKKDFPAKDLKEFVAYVKANGAKLNEAHAGVGSVSFTSCLSLNHILGVKPTRIPYTGTGPSMNALVAGQVDYMCDQIVNAVPQVQAGTIKAYAVATPERNPALPDVVSTKEAGLPEYQVSAWNALFAPKGTPKAALDKLTDALNKALDDQGVRKRLLDLGSDLPEGNARGQAALAAHVKAEVDRWTPIIKAAGAEAK